jgi:hypothetical protein
MTATAPSKIETYVAWHKASPREPWRRVGTAATREAAWRLLSPLRRQLGECAVVPAGVDPRNRYHAEVTR